MAWNYHRSLYSQLPIDIVFEMIIQHCPLLVELDICGLKSATVQHLQYLIDQRAQVVAADPTTKPFATFYCRFIGEPLLCLYAFVLTHTLSLTHTNIYIYACHIVIVVIYPTFMLFLLNLLLFFAE